MSVVLTKTLALPPVCEKEALHYAGCKLADEKMLSLLHECINEAGNRYSGKVCYTLLKINVAESVCDFGAFELRSNDLAKTLGNCGEVLLFAATVGVELDRLIQKYSKVSPSKALMLQAIGAERIEALCDMFCADIQKEHLFKLTPRFSAGYGDLPLEVQRDIFKLLDPPRKIGLSLTDSLLMSPTKSVTAFAGIERG